MLHIFIADGFEEVETFTTIDILRRCGLEVVLVSVTGTRLIRGAHGISVMVDTVFRRGDLLKSLGLILPGGMPGAKNLGHHDGLRKLLLHHAPQRTLIAAICAAPSVLGMHGLLRGRRATCYPGFEAELDGAIVSDAMLVEDDNFITARGPAAAVDFAFAIASRFVESTVVARVKGDMLYLNTPAKAANGTGNPAILPIN